MGRADAVEKPTSYCSSEKFVNSSTMDNSYILNQRYHHGKPACYKWGLKYIDQNTNPESYGRLYLSFGNSL